MRAPVTRPRALGTAVVAALLFGWRTYAHETLAGATGGDFAVYRNAALELLAGRNPYDATTLLYPLPSVLVVTPLVRLSPVMGAAVFAGAGVLALVYGLLRRRGWLGLTMLLSPSFFLGWFYLQWSPLIVAGALLPWLGGFGVCKPNLEPAPFAYRPSWKPLAGALLLLAVSFLIVPHWIPDWLADVRRQTTRHTIVLLWPLGFVGVAGALRWRTAEGRALLAMTVSPLNPQFYDHLGVWLACKDWRESLALSLTGWAGFLTFVATAPHDLTRNPSPAYLSLTLGVYLPAAVLAALGWRRDLVRGPKL
jgi:hypothetical protein